MYSFATALILLFFTLVHAQNGTVDLLLPADDPQNLYASIVSAVRKDLGTKLDGDVD